MEGRATDHKNLNLAELNRQVIRGTSNGKIIFQPRIMAWFSDKSYLGQPLPEPYTEMEPNDVYRAIGCSNRCYEFNWCFQVHEDPSVIFERIDIDEMSQKHVLHTPVGDLFTILRRNSSNPGHYSSKFQVETEEDLKILIWLEERRTYSFSQEIYDQLMEKVGDLGLPSQYVPRVNLQKLIVEAMGVEGTVYALADYPDTVEEYCKVVNESEKGYLKALADSPIEYVNFGDNIHCGVLPPYLFEKYVLPTYQSRNEFLHKYNKFTSAHWDGDVKTLLPYAKETGLDGIEALTPVPQGDVTIEEMKEALGDDLFVLDGIPAVFFDDVYPVEMLKECVDKLIKYFAPKLILGISDEMSSTGNIDRIKMVTEWVDDYNASV